MHGMLIPELSSELSSKVVTMMCHSAAESVKLQCGREYGFSEGEQMRATNLSTLSGAELDNLPTNNLKSERDLSRFDREARVARCRNRKFKAKNIRNNMVLHKTKNQIKVDRISKKIALILGDRETKWNNQQRQKQKERVAEKLKKAEKAKYYTGKLPCSCKSRGPHGVHFR